MDGRLCTNSKSGRQWFALKLITVVVGICCLPIGGVARQIDQNSCRQNLAASDNSGNPIVITMDELRKNPEDYYGKTVTVDGEMHRTFTDNVFTIEDSGFFRDHDVLVISTVPKPEAVTAVGDSIEKGKDVRVTGVVRPYERGALECAYGPLNLESREGHSFTKSPVLIVDKTQTAKVEMPPPALEKPIPAPEPAPAPEPSAILIVPELQPEPAPAPSLPKTAGELPLLAAAGLFALCARQILKRRSIS